LVANGTATWRIRKNGCYVFFLYSPGGSIVHGGGLRFLAGILVLIVIGRLSHRTRSTQPGHPSVSDHNEYQQKRHTARRTSPVSVVSQYKLVSG